MPFNEMGRGMGMCMGMDGWMQLVRRHYDATARFATFHQSNQTNSGGEKVSVSLFMMDVCS